MRQLLASLVLIALVAPSCAHGPSLSPGDPKLLFPGEKRLANVRQLTRGGTNAEAYWSFDGTRLTFQHKAAAGAKPECDQIFTMRADGTDVRQVSNGRGRTTCSYYYPEDSRVLYSSTFASDEACPPPPDFSKGYVWPIYASYQMYSAKPDGSDLFPIEPGAPKAYNAEATVCKDGSVVFTSDRSGDLELHVAKLDSLGTIKDVKQVTKTLGYDGGAFFSPDCRSLVWRASRPRPGAEEKAYKELLGRHLVKPTELEIWLADADGTHARQLTRAGAASFAPFFTPDSKHVIFASNPRDPRGRKFDLYRIGTDGTRLERVTFSDTFESFPMFSPDGRYLAFSSNRNASQPHETNVFVADWVDSADAPLSLEDPDPANRFLALVERLAAPELEGRGTGSPGLAKAEDLVAERFASVGMKPYVEAFGGALAGDHANAEGLFERFKQNVATKNPKTGKLSTDHNVIGTLGECRPRDPLILIGAHLDHLGMGGEGNSLEPSGKGIHPGADDNASGVAAILEAARIIAMPPRPGSMPPRPGAAGPPARACFAFAAFAGEEIGDAGSNVLAKALAASRLKPKAMLNLDMVGRMENNKLIAFGSDSAPEWARFIEEECAARRLDCPKGGDGLGPSDHMPFFLAGVPVLHFFTGPHVDYHRSSDTADKVNATGGVQAAELVAAVALRAAAASTRFHFTKASNSPLKGDLHLRGKKGNGAYLGTIPDYSALTSPHGPSGGGEPGGGVKLAGTRPGSPAEKAGILAGDVLLAINARKIATLEEFMGILLDLHPGDAVALSVKRGDKPLELKATVGKRE